MAASELKQLIEKRREIRAKQRSLDLDFDDIGKRMAEIAEESDVASRQPAKKKAAKKSREPNHDAVAKRYADLVPCPTGCLCGCGEDVGQGGVFVKGHQQQLKSIALAVEADKLPVNKLSDAGLAHAEDKGWVTR